MQPGGRAAQLGCLLMLAWTTTAGATETARTSTVAAKTHDGGVTIPPVVAESGVPAPAETTSNELAPAAASAAASAGATATSAVGALVAANGVTSAAATVATGAPATVAAAAAA
ncbi:MAG TPA: hypothetical protein VIA18_06710, partial [Polyangia bacterium]|nr:hypothetical protein [Polyangia bacterium]